MFNIKLFQKSKLSQKANAGGPEAYEILQAMAEGTYWTIIGAEKLQICPGDKAFNNNANAFKNALQVYGPIHRGLPHLRRNKGTEEIWHGHIKDCNNTDYNMEWTVIEQDLRIIEILNVGAHKNYRYIQKDRTAEQKKETLTMESTLKKLIFIETKITEAQQKVARVKCNYRLQPH